MSGIRPADLLRHLAGGDAEAPDRDLLRRYVSTRDHAAFAELVRRHGPVVLAACLRGTFRREDAEDSFQAVFLILARRAGAVGQPELLGSWLYRVAVRVARDARRAAARRRVREVQGVDVPEPVSPPTTTLHDFGPVLDEELEALPALYRNAVVLCDLRCVSRADAAAQLGIPLGTLASRLNGARKKLAARLVRRGVTLSVGAVLVEARAVALPEGLLSKTCEVVAVWSAGGALPQSVVKLVQGGVYMKGVMLGGALALSLVAGIVVAGSPEKPAPVPNTPPVPGEVAGEEAQPPGPKGREAKAVAVGAPRLHEALDLPMRPVWWGVTKLTWSPTGDRLVVAFTPEPWAAGGEPPTGAAGGKSKTNPPEESLLVVQTDGPKGPHVFGSIPAHGPERFVGFTPDGNELLMTRREHGLVSGRHQASFWGIGVPGAAGLPGSEPAEGGVFTPAGRTLSLVPYDKRFPLNPEQTDDFAFAPDGKSYTTLVVTRRDDLGVRAAEVRRVGTEAGKTLATLKTLTGAFRGLRLSADGKRVFHAHAQETNAVGGGGWSAHPDIGHADGDRGEILLMPSRDGATVVFARGVSRLVALDGATGKTLPDLEGAGLVDAKQTTAALSADGRLLAACYSQFEKREVKGVGSPQTGGKAGERRLAVWDTTTGRLVQSWPGRVTALAFHPTRPILAVLEPHGNGGRLGLWDFSAQP